MTPRLKRPSSPEWLKVVLGSQGVEFEYTHDLHRLIADTEPLDRRATVALVNEVGEWAEAKRKGPLVGGRVKGAPDL